MNILVLYALSEKKPRKTIIDSLYCFSQYDQRNSYFYFNILDIKTLQKLGEIKSIHSNMAAIIIHYSAIAQRYDQTWWNKNKELLINTLTKFNCVKVIIPQDEYNYNGNVKEFIQRGGITQIYTCAYERDYEKLYPSKLGYKHIETVFTGYIDEETLKKIGQRGIVRNSNRTVDIGYRARKLPYWLGSHGQLKYELAEIFLKTLRPEDNLKYDIANTDDKHVFYGNDWLDYLLSCRTALGCLGGSGLLDEDGTIAKSVDEYVRKNPNASFQEVEEHCFKGKDNYIHLFALSPRHFECAMTKTCQVLVEGDYAGVFRADIDYIELKKDFSNILQVIEKIKDKDYCEKIADNCYKHVVGSDKYTYAAFVKKIIENIEQEQKCYKSPIEICTISNITLKGLCNYSKWNILYGLSPTALKWRLKCVIYKSASPYKDTALYKYLKRVKNTYLDKDKT